MKRSLDLSRKIIPLSKSREVRAESFLRGTIQKHPIRDCLETSIQWHSDGGSLKR